MFPSRRVPAIVLALMGLAILGQCFLASSAPVRINSHDEVESTKPGQPTASDTPHNFTVIDCRKIADWTQGRGHMLASIEGIVNKAEPNLYLIWNDLGASWFEYINASGLYVGSEIVFSDVFAIVDHFKIFFDGIILFDPNDVEQANMATPLCGAARSLLVPQALYATVKGYYDGLVRYNMSDIVASYGLATRVAKYEYMYEHFYPLCNQSALGLLPSFLGTGNRGFLIANNLYTFWRILYVESGAEEPGGVPRQPDPPEELAFFERVLDETPYNIPIFGFPYADGTNEGVFVSETSKRGKYVVACDWFYDLSFFSKMRLPDGYTLHQNRSIPTPELKNKIYVTAMWSDGDNIQYVTTFMRETLWANRDPGKVPTGWTICSLSPILIPWVMKYYYENASTTDYFISGVSGKGYIYPEEMNVTALQSYYTEANQFMAECDLTEMWTMRIGTAAGTVTGLVNSTVHGIYDGYGGDQYVRPQRVNGVPIISSIGVNKDNINQTFDYIMNMKTGPIDQPIFLFLFLHCWSGGPDPQLWVKLGTRLQEAGIEVLRTDQFTNLLNEANLDAPINATMVAWNGIVLAILLTIGVVSASKKLSINRRARQSPAIAGKI
nr:GxGYxYP family putative glycoside hydrolase [Candidatus Sigynarchaeota archaeon]